MKVEQLGSDRQALSFSLHFDPESVRVVETPFGHVLDLPDGVADGEPGGPAIPVVVLEVALPPGARIANVAVEAEGVTVLLKEGLVAPRQPAAPGVRRCPPPLPLREDGLVRPWASPPFVPPNPKLYDRAVALGMERAQITRVDDSGPQPIAALVVRPLTLDSRGQLTLARQLRVTVQLTPPGDDARSGDAPSGASGFSSGAQARRWTELVRSRVVNTKDVLDIGAGFRWELFGSAEYLIITDNVAWSERPVARGAALDGDLVAEFERLAAWKRTKGLTARVVTVTDIVNGRYGTFHGSCRRDLQEVLREFVKWAHAHWGTAWLLLGGDLTIVPARSVVGFVGGFTAGPADPPAPGGAFWTGTFLKINAAMSSDTPLLRASDGRRIPYDATGASGPTRIGWYFTDASYTTRSTMPTGFIRVNGPAADVNTELFWLTGDNTIPSDLYYADVAGWPARSANGTWTFLDEVGKLGRGVAHLCGGHDWDAIGNGLYGQWRVDADLDGVRYVADLSVGRAPVGNAGEARTFVNKVLAYEQQTGFLASTQWLRRLLMVSANWGGRASYGPAPTLTDDRYTRAAGSSHTVVQLSQAPSSLALRLLSHVSDTDERLLTFRRQASPTQPGWYFATSATSLAPSVATIHLPWQPPITFPVPSRWIVVFGANDELSPQYFVLDTSMADGSMLDQETLRTQLAADMPLLSDVRRLYEDDVDLPPPVGPVPLEHLSETGLEAQLDRGPHIVSLSGHGYWGGCCGLNPGMRTSLTNGARTFIAYADSCLTNQFDVEDAISERLIQNEHGGAVAYVGSTRFSWIGVGDDFQRNFFRGLPATRTLGTLHDRRLAMVNAGTGFWPVYNRWTIHALNLMGDPEMRIWTHVPWRLCLELPAVVHMRGHLVVQVLRDTQPVPGAVVSLDQGAGILMQRRADGRGEARFDLDGVTAGDLHVTATHPSATMTRTTITARGWRLVDVTVRAVQVAGDAANVRVRARDGEHERVMNVAADATQVLPVLATVSGSDRTVRLWVDDDDSVVGVDLGA